MCGKDCYLLIPVIISLGLPPRAGRTISTLSISIVRWDHPRICGKDLADCLPIISFIGSPLHVREGLLLPFTAIGSHPLVREGLPHGFVVYLNSGITPARAGRTHSVNQFLAVYEDHPRSHGKDHV